MTGPFDDQIREWAQSGRISKEMADALIEHYSKQANPPPKDAGGAPPSVDLMELMNLIDLLEKKGGLKQPFVPQDSPAQDKRASGLPSQFVSDEIEFPRLSPVLAPGPSDSAGGMSPYEELKKKCEALEAELAAERKAHEEFSEKEFAYAKRFADAEEQRRQAQADEEQKRKQLEEENRRLAEELKQAHEEEARLKRKIGGLEILIETPRAQALVLEQRCAEYEKEIENLNLERKSLELEKQTLAAAVDGKQADLSQYQEAAASVEALKARTLDLENGLQEANKRLEVLQSEKAGLENDKQRLESENQAFRGALAGKDSEMEGVRSRVGALECALQEAAQRYEAVRAEKDRVESDLQRALRGQEEKQAAIAVLGSDKKALEEEIRSLELSKKAWEGERDHLERGKRQLEEELKKHAEKATLGGQECERLLGEAVRMREEAEKAFARIRDLEETLSRAQGQTEELRRHCVELETEVEQRRGDKAEKNRFEEELKRERETLGKVQAHTKYLETTLLTLEKQIDALSR